MRKYTAALDNYTNAEPFGTAELATKTSHALFRRTWIDRFLKRTTDVVTSLVVLVLGFPFLLAIALLIKIDLQGARFL